MEMTFDKSFFDEHLDHFFDPIIARIKKELNTEEAARFFYNEVVRRFEAPKK